MRCCICPSSARACVSFGSSASARSNSSFASASRRSSDAAMPAPRCRRAFFGSAAIASRKASAAACAWPAVSAFHAQRSTSALRGSICAPSPAANPDTRTRVTNKLRFIRALRIMSAARACRQSYRLCRRLPNQWSSLGRDRQASRLPSISPAAACRRLSSTRTTRLAASPKRSSTRASASISAVIVFSPKCRRCATSGTSCSAMICNRFGRRLFEMFFKGYTEKVWGMPCSAIGAEWAAQRIKGLSLWTAALSMLGGNGNGDIRTLVHEFEYPRLGPGMMWEACRHRIERAGGRVTLGSRIVGVQHDADRVTSVVVEQSGERRRQPASHVISTMPVRHLVKAMSPVAPRDVQAAADRLKYRDFLTVALIVNQASVFPDNWIYVHDPSVRVGRIQNFKNWSPEMVPDPGLTCLGLEYFCSQGDELWSMDDADLVALATREVETIGLVRPGRVIDATIMRVHKAYPIYDDGHVTALARARAWLARLANLQLVGRNGMHKYNNQDHSMLTALLAVKNILGGKHNLWDVNVEEEYHEEVTSSEEAAQARAL